MKDLIMTCLLLGSWVVTVIISYHWQIMKQKLDETNEIIKVLDEENQLLCVERGALVIERKELEEENAELRSKLGKHKETIARQAGMIETKEYKARPVQLFRLDGANKGKLN